MPISTTPLTTSGPFVIMMTEAARRAYFGDFEPDVRMDSLRSNVLASDVQLEFAQHSTAKMRVVGMLLAFARRHAWSGEIRAVTIATAGEAVDPAWTEPAPPSAHDIALRAAEEDRDREERAVSEAKALRASAVERATGHRDELLYELALAARLIDANGHRIGG